LVLGRENEILTTPRRREDEEFIEASRDKFQSDFREDPVKETSPWRRKVASFIVLVFVIPIVASAAAMPDGNIFFQTTPVVQTILPDSGFAPGWEKSEALRTFTGQDLFNHIDGGAELFLEFGFVKLSVQAYASGKAELTLNAYEMESSASALGIYLMKMGRETPFAEV
jgi:hypothetical protein